MPSRDIQIFKMCPLRDGNLLGYGINLIDNHEARITIQIFG